MANLEDQNSAVSENKKGEDQTRITGSSGTDTGTGTSFSITNNSRTTIATDTGQIFSTDFYLDSERLQHIFEILFHLKRRGTTFQRECYYGVIQFLACVYCLPVVADQLEKNGYDRTQTVSSTSLLCGFGCVLSGLLSNLPFIVAPPTSIAVYFSVAMTQNQLEIRDSNLTLIVCGGFLLLFAFRPLLVLGTNLIPKCIQIGTTVGIGLITCLAGLIDINFVLDGEYTVLRSGKITDEVIIAFCGIVMIAVLLSRQVQIAFCVPLVINSLIWWAMDGFPSSAAAIPTVDLNHGISEDFKYPRFVITLTILFILVLNGLTKSQTKLAHVERKNPSANLRGIQAIPRARWVFVVCGVANVMSALVGGPPMLLSPESAAGIKAGAKTGLSTISCGIFFCISSFFSPIIANVPSCATSPLLVMVAVILFRNVNMIDWTRMEDAAPAFIVMSFIPFTFSILSGVLTGSIFYCAINLLSEDFYTYVSTHTMPIKELLRSYIQRFADEDDFHVDVAAQSTYDLTINFVDNDDTRSNDSYFSNSNLSKSSTGGNVNNVLHHTDN